MPTSPGSEGAGAEPVEPDESVAPTDERDAELEALRTGLARADDRVRRALADLDNYRKRTEREGDRRAARARDALLLQWLEAVDSVERALAMEPGDPGLTAVLDQMNGILARNGVIRLAEVGDAFDPRRHEAIAVQPSADAPKGSILAVARSGFGTEAGDVIRTAQVVVAAPPAGDG